MIKGIIIAIAALTATVCLPYSYETGGKQHDKTFSIYVNVQPDLGWKWNAAYPAKFRVKFNGDSDGSYSFTGGNIAMEYWTATMPTKATVIASFSLCTKTVCKSFRNKEFKISFGAIE